MHAGLSAEAVRNLDRVNQTWLKMAIRVETDAANNRTQFVANYIRHQRRKGRWASGEPRCARS